MSPRPGTRPMMPSMPNRIRVKGMRKLRRAEFKQVERVVTKEPGPVGERRRTKPFAQSGGESGWIAGSIIGSLCSEAQAY